jgi:hypothetical protein
MNSTLTREFRPTTLTRFQGCQAWSLIPAMPDRHIVVNIIKYGIFCDELFTFFSRAMLRTADASNKDVGVSRYCFSSSDVNVDEMIWNSSWASYIIIINTHSQTFIKQLSPHTCCCLLIVQFVVLSNARTISVGSKDFDFDSGLLRAEAQIVISYAPYEQSEGYVYLTFNRLIQGICYRSQYIITILRRYNHDSFIARIIHTFCL